MLYLKWVCNVLSVSSDCAAISLFASGVDRDWLWAPSSWQS
jgi:hypothetical protein